MNELQQYTIASSAQGLLCSMFMLSFVGSALNKIRMNQHTCLVSIRNTIQISYGIWIWLVKQFSKSADLTIQQNCDFCIASLICVWAFIWADCQVWACPNTSSYELFPIFGPSVPIGLKTANVHATIDYSMGHIYSFIKMQVKCFSELYLHIYILNIPHVQRWKEYKNIVLK